MSSYRIISDVAADIPINFIENNNIHMIPMEITIDDQIYKHTYNYENFSFEEFYEMIKEGKLPVTAQINSYTFEQEFEPFLEKGEDLLYICLSSQLSGLYNQALFAAKNLLEKYPERKIEIVDSLAGTGGQGLMVMQAVKNKELGMSVEENSDYLNSNVLDFSLWFMVEDLFHLKRGGRISATSAIIGSALNIKPILHIANDGKLIPMIKARGIKQGLKEIVNKYNELKNPDFPDDVLICHSNALDRAKDLESILIKKHGFEKVEILPLSPVIGSHVGVGMVTLDFRGKR